MKKVLAFLSALVLLFSMVTGCASSQSSAGQSAQSQAQSSAAAKSVRVGIFEPMTGGNAAWGEYEARGVELAHSLFPTVKIGGDEYSVELVTVDNKSDAVEAATAAARLVEKEKVAVSIGCAGSSLCMAGGDSFKAGKVPAIAASATSPNVTLGNDYYFRVCFLDTFQGKALATYAGKELGLKKAAIIYEITNDTCVGMKEPMKKAYESYGGEIVAEASFSLNDTDFSSQLIAVMAKNPEVIFAPGNYAEVALLIKQARQLGYNDVIFMSTDACDVDEFIKIGGDALEGTFITTHFDCNASDMTEMTQKFISAYKEKYDGEPATLSALAFDAYLAAIYAMEKAESTDGEAIRNALASLEFEGSTGKISFDENGDAQKNLVVLKQVKDGAWSYYNTVDMG